MPGANDTRLTAVNAAVLKADAGADPVGFRDEGGADLDGKAAERHPVAGFAMSARPWSS
jgi:hypothetical protein